MNLKRILLAALALTLPLAGAQAQQWSTNTLPPGLVAWWPAEGNLLDSAGAHNGTGSAAPTYGPGRYGQAFQFNGTDQSVMIPDGYADLDAWTQFTLEAWVNFDRTDDAPGPGRCVISKVGNNRGPYSGNYGYQFGFANGCTKLFCQFNSDLVRWPGFQTSVNLPVTISTGVWYHVAASYDHSAVKLYFNGVPIATNVVGPVTIANTSATLRISKDDNNNVAFAGRIDDPRIYARALSAAEVTHLYQGPTLPVTQGLKLHLDAGNVNGDGNNPAPGASVTTWRDLSGNGIDATSTGYAAPLYRLNVLNGRGGVDFGASGSDALATAISSRLDFTNCTILLVANGADTGTHISISAATLLQEFCIFDKGIQHHSSAFHYVYRSHQDMPAGFYLQTALFGVKASQTDSLINGVASTNGFLFGQQSPTLADVADYTRVNRQAVLGWRNSDAYGGAPAASENFRGVLCEVLVYDRQLRTQELDSMHLCLAGKYNLVVAPLPPTLHAQLATSNLACLSWETAPGRAYQLQSTANLLATNWLNLGAPFPGTGGVLTTNVPIGYELGKFFRLQLGN